VSGPSPGARGGTAPFGPMPSRTHAAGRLVELVRRILDETRPAYSLGAEIASLAKLLRERATIRIDPSRVVADGETKTIHGLALSPTMAGRCADDIARTAVFLRGLNRAVEESRKLERHRPIRVLYAGCGPYALLAVPSMSIFGPEELRFTLLDIHRPSIDSARVVVEALGLGECVESYEVCDACQYRIPTDRTPDIILSETMNACLKKEPQVAISRHLLAQASSAMLVPEAVRVDAYLVNVGREFSFVEPGSSGVAPKRDRVFLGRVFELSAESIASWAHESGDRLPAYSVHVPRPLEARYTPMLLTTVVVHADHVLEAYDSGLTIPKRIPFDDPIRGGDTLGFHYQLGSHPELVCDGRVG